VASLVVRRATAAAAAVFSGVDVSRAREEPEAQQMAALAHSTRTVLPTAAAAEV
jgi:hypothetical protein